MTETLANGYSSESTQRELSNEYQHDRVSMVFNNLRFLVLCTNVASALEGLSKNGLTDIVDAIALLYVACSSHCWEAGKFGGNVISRLILAHQGTRGLPIWRRFRQQRSPLIERD